MESETFSTLPTISKKLKLNINHNLVNVCSQSKKIKIDGKIFYNENDIIKVFVNKQKYLYIRIDSQEQSEQKDEWIKEFNEKFSDYNIVVGISSPEIINSSLIFLLRLCARKDIDEVIFYSKTNSASKELMEVLTMFFKLNGVKLFHYKN